MKTIISSMGDSVESQFDLRFGRAKYFCIYDSENDTTIFISNDQSQAQSGAGTKAAELAVEQKAERVISGDFGPKAKKILEKMKVQLVIIEDSNYTINDIIEKIK